MMETYNTTCHANLRTTPDRRTKPTSCWSALRLRGRRRKFRRTGEDRNQYVDCPTPYVVILVLGVIVGSALDALFTLLYVTNGGGEANPIMALALTYGGATFVGLKMSITCVGSWILSVLQQFRLAHIVLHSLMLVYVGILGLHAVIWLS